MRYRLPPMNAMRVFEAAGRHGTIKGAAQELQITPSAVSHGVQTLEEWLGQVLFSRRREGLVLTRAGSIYFKAATEALRCLAESTPGAASRGKLVVSAAPTFAARILVPRLYKLRQILLDISIDIDTSHTVVDFERSGVDVAIRLGTGDWEGLEAIPLLTETLVPMCSPALKKRMGGTVGLDHTTLIHLTPVSQDWAAWFDATGQPAPDLSRGLMVDTIQLAVAAAVQGLGICMGRRPLIDAELAAGALVECGAPVDCRTSYYLVAPAANLRSPEVQRFKSWITSEMSQSAVLRR
jgi:LysR family transcriptional regulator, glycine cleavage system transcriptional activator